MKKRLSPFLLGVKMEILICSDSHGTTDNLLRLAEDHPSATHLFLCGDGLRDLSVLEEAFPRLVIASVCGNCDGFSLACDAPSERLVELFGLKILLMHGHTHGVKSGGTERLYRYALARGADILIFGHSHLPFEQSDVIDGKRIYLFNPGSIGKRELFGYSYGVLTIQENGFLLSHGRYR